MSETMNSKQVELWKRIEAFEIDEPGAAFSFESRLANENAWSIETSRRVIGEYKKFVFLAMCAGHPVTPSDQVDQAWHLHLTYTRSYWERMCKGMLPRALHHDPTKGGAAENEKFDDWYARTKESYARLFGEEAPADVWPEASVRFGDDLHFQRINTQHNWVVPKRGAKRAVGAAMCVGGCAALVAGCGPLLFATVTTEDEAPTLLIILAVLFVAMVLIGALRGKHRRDSTGGSCSSGGCATSGSSGCSGGGCGGGGCGGGGD